MDQATACHSTPRTDSSPFHRLTEQAPVKLATPERADDLAGMAWWNSLTERDRRRWMRIAGDTGRAVDAWSAFKRAQNQSSGRELDPKDVLKDLFEVELLPDPAAMADGVIQRLIDAGFEIIPAERHQTRR